ncbi:MAG: hypothetical protein ACLQMH_04675 [Solirubrobacteraceae bacterium]
MEIRSYRRVFDLERRIYRVDRMRLNPGGVPVRGVVYFLVLLTAALLARRLPLVAMLAQALPWYVGDLALPAVSAAVFTLIRVEGRPFHVAAYALLRHRMECRQLSHLRPCAARVARWRPEEIILLPDGSDGRLRRMSYAGPGGVLVAVEHEREGRGSDDGTWGLGFGRRRTALVLRELQGGRMLSRRQVIALGPSARLLVGQTRARKRVAR